MVKTAFLLLLLLCPLAEATILPNRKNHPEKRPCTVAVAAIFQDEAPFLKEWLEYHKLIGVGHFYLYNNRSCDDFKKLLRPYIECGEVELFDIPIALSNKPLYLKWQVAAYNHALKLARPANQWLACIDIDEFICLKQGDSLIPLLADYAHAGGLTLNWVMYGTSHIYDLLPGELLIEKMTRRFPLDWSENRMVKSIVQPQYTKRCLDAHTFLYAGHIFAVYPDHQKFSHTPPFAVPPVETLCLNHYWYRTEKFFFETKLPRRRIWGDPRTLEEFQAHLQLANSVEDLSMQRFVAPLKNRIARLEQP
jgi:Glycosyltransferase family 92